MYAMDKSGHNKTQIYPTPIFSKKKLQTTPKTLQNSKLSPKTPIFWPTFFGIYCHLEANNESHMARNVL